MSGEREALAKVLAEHAWGSQTERGWKCKCGMWTPMQAQHVADALLAAGWRGPETVAQVKAEALREAADEIGPRLSRAAVIVTLPECHKRGCGCAATQQGDPTEFVDLIADAFRDRLRQRADRIAANHPEARSEAPRSAEQGESDHGCHRDDDGAGEASA